MILAATPGFCEMSGYDHRQVVGRTSADLDLWADPVQRTQMMERLAEAGAVTDFDGGLRRRTGEVLRCRISAQTVDFDGEAHIFIVLHDVTDPIQVMTAALLMLDRARRSDAQRALEEACEIVREAIERTRRLTFQLRPPLLERDGLEPALRVLLEDAAEDAGWRTTLRIDCNRYAFGIEDLVYRTIQEMSRTPVSMPVLAGSTSSWSRPAASCGRR